MTLLPQNTMSPGQGGEDRNKFIQFGVMPQYGFNTLNLQPYMAIVKQKNSITSSNRYDRSPQIAVFPLNKYDVRGDPTFSINPYIPYQMQVSMDINELNKSVSMSVLINNLYKNSSNPQYSRWYFSISGGAGYQTSSSRINNILDLPYYVYPVGLLQQTRGINVLSASYDSTQFRALTAWYNSINATDTLACLGRWSSSRDLIDTDNSFIRSLFGSTAGNYGVRYMVNGSSKFPDPAAGDNLQLSTDFYQQDIDSAFKNVRVLGQFGPIGYNYLTQRQQILSKKRDGRLIRDTAQKITDKIDKGLFVASPSDKTDMQSINLSSTLTMSWWQKVYAGLGNYYYPHSGPFGSFLQNNTNYPYNTIIFHMPWVVWNAADNSLLLAPVIVGPLRRTSTQGYVYDLFASHAITGAATSVRQMLPVQLGADDKKAPSTKFGIAHKGRGGTQFFFDNSYTGLTGSQSFSVAYNDNNFYRLQKNGTTAKLFVNNFPVRVIDSLSSSYSRNQQVYMTFNHSICVQPSGTGFIYAGDVDTGFTRDVTLDNMSVHGWRQQLQFPISLMDMNIWSNINHQLAKLTNIAICKKTGNVSIDFMSAKKTTTDDQLKIDFDYSDSDQIFDINYSMSARRFAPPSSLLYNSGSRISVYDVSVPFKIKGDIINDVSYVKSNKKGTPGSQYYTLTVNRYMDDVPMVYLGQTGTDDVNRMNTLDQWKAFTDNYLNDSIPGGQTFKQMWSNGSSFLASNSRLSRGYQIGMTEDVLLSHCARTGLDYYVNVYSTLANNFVYSQSGHSQNWQDSRFTFDSSVTGKYVQFKIDIPVSMFNADQTPFTPIRGSFNAYDISFYPTTGLINQYGYPSTTSLSAYGYYGVSGDMSYRGYQKDVIYSYAAVRRSNTRQYLSTDPATGGMWKALQIGNTLGINNMTLGNGLKFKFRQV